MSEILPESSDAPVSSTGRDESVAYLEQSLQQLRVQICGLGIGFILVGVALGLFVYKQNRELSRGIEMRSQQMQQMQQVEQRWMPAIQELARYSSASAELREIFARFGLQFGTNQPPAGSTTP